MAEVQTPVKPAASPPSDNPLKRKRRFGDRYDGRRLRSLDPLNTILYFVLNTRTGAANQFFGKEEIRAAERYIRQKRADGLKGFGMLVFFLTLFVRIVSQRPALNRFVAGHRMYARNSIDINFAVKKSLSVDGQETTVKITCDPRDTAEDVYRRVVEAVELAEQEGDSNEVDGAARALKHLPRPIMTFFVWFMKFLDQHGRMPKALNKVSPFHGTLFLADLGSINLPPVHHHLYDFGNCGLFLVFGRKNVEYVLDRDGKPKEQRYIEYSLTLDERICDGYYFSKVHKMVHDIFQNPEQLDHPPERVVEDVD